MHAGCAVVAPGLAVGKLHVHLERACRAVGRPSARARAAPIRAVRDVVFGGEAQRQLHNPALPEPPCVSPCSSVLALTYRASSSRLRWQVWPGSRLRSGVYPRHPPDDRIFRLVLAACNGVGHTLRDSPVRVKAVSRRSGTFRGLEGQDEWSGDELAMKIALKRDFFERVGAPCWSGCRERLFSAFCRRRTQRDSGRGATVMAHLVSGRARRHTRHADFSNASWERETRADAR